MGLIKAGLGALGGVLQNGLLVAIVFPVVMLVFTLLVRPEKG